MMTISRPTTLDESSDVTLDRFAYNEHVLQVCHTYSCGALTSDLSCWYLRPLGNSTMVPSGTKNFATWCIMFISMIVELQV